MARKVNLREALAVKADTLLEASQNGLATAENYRTAAQQAEQEAVTAARHQEAVVQALHILDEAGVAL